MFNFIKTSIFGDTFGKNVDFGLDPIYLTPKKTPFIPFGADLFVHLNHKGIQLTLNITGEIISCV